MMMTAASPEPMVMAPPAKADGELGERFTAQAKQLEAQVRPTRRLGTAPRAD
jgi:hypothetical protein